MACLRRLRPGSGPFRPAPTVGTGPGLPGVAFLARKAHLGDRFHPAGPAAQFQPAVVPTACAWEGEEETVDVDGSLEGEGGGKGGGGEGEREGRQEDIV